jgi:hypothetical protein
MAVWLAVKLAFVEVYVPARTRHRAPKVKAQLLASLVPEGQTLYVLRLKDEGIMFYYHRPVRRLQSPAQLAAVGPTAYCILEQAEWDQWPREHRVDAVRYLRDEQGAPIVLVKSLSRPAGAGFAPVLVHGVSQ